MPEPRRSSRRLSARPGDKEDAPAVNGIAHGNEKGKSDQASGTTTKQTRAAANNAANAGAKGKRKFGTSLAAMKLTEVHWTQHRFYFLLSIVGCESVLFNPSNLDVIDYEEDSDGFPFTRTRAKKAKAEPASQIPPIPEDRQEETPKVARVRKPRRRTSGSPNAAGAENEGKPDRRRRSGRNSGDKDLVAENRSSPPPLEVKKKRKTKEDASQETRKSKRNDQATSSQKSQEPSAAEARRAQPVEKPLDPIKVSLPFADTPIIRRNKEMRKGAENGSRRSSLGMRGRRASSLIDSGKSDGKRRHYLQTPRSSLLIRLQPYRTTKSRRRNITSISKAASRNLGA